MQPTKDQNLSVPIPFLSCFSSDVYSGFGRPRLCELLLSSDYNSSYGDHKNAVKEIGNSRTS